MSSYRELQKEALLMHQRGTSTLYSQINQNSLINHDESVRITYQSWGPNKPAKPSASSSSQVVEKQEQFEIDSILQNSRG